MAEVLGGKASVPACELLVIRARADLDAGRTREAALQIRVGLEAMLAEREALAAPDQDQDFATLDERRRITGEAANEALAGELGRGPHRRGHRDPPDRRARAEAQAGAGLGHLLWSRFDPPGQIATGRSAT